MDKAELDRLKLEALRTLAAEAGIGEARTLGRAELIARLSDDKPSLVERAKEAVAHAVERVEEKAHELADRVRHLQHPEPPASADEGPAGETRAPDDKRSDETARPENRMGVPSSTVHPHLPPHQHGEPLGMLDFEELPETYCVDECEVVAKDPHHVFAWWEVTDGGLDGARAQLGNSAGAARLVMRLFTTVPTNGHVEREIKDVDLSWNHGRRYLPAPRAGAHLRIAVGLLSPEGYFAPITHSSLVRVPPTEPQPGPIEWMEVVPARRGRGREPLVIVRRSGDHDERGVRTPGAPASGGQAGGSSPAAGGLPWVGPSSSPTGRRGDGGR